MRQHAYQEILKAVIDMKFFFRGFVFVKKLGLRTKRMTKKKIGKKVKEIKSLKKFSSSFFFQLYTTKTLNFE